MNNLSVRKSFLLFWTDENFKRKYQEFKESDDVANWIPLKIKQEKWTFLSDQFLAKPHFAEVNERSRKTWDW